MLELFKRFAENAYVNLVSGLILLATSGMEILESLEEDGVGAHHGVALFAFVTILRVFPEIVHGSEQVTKLERNTSQPGLEPDGGMAAEPRDDS